MDAVALGEILVDFSCREVDPDGFPSLQAHAGGAPANWLAALSKYGCSTAMIGKVGDDVFGRLLLRKLSSVGISTDGVVVDGSVFTTLAFVTFNAENDREFSFARKPGADVCLREQEVPYSMIDACKVFHFGTLSLTDEPSRTATVSAVEHAKAAGKLISFDPNLRKPLWRDLEEARRQILWGLAETDVLKISDDEILFVFGTDDYCSAAQMLLDRFGISLVFITLGRDGCVFANRNACRHVSVPAGISVVDTTGAGDIFGGSAMSRLLKADKSPADLDMEELEGITRFACCAASLSTTRSGGIDSVPDLDQVLGLCECVRPRCLP